MKLKVVVSLLAFLSFFATVGRGQEYSKLDLFGGYSYLRANPSGGALASFNMNGAEASLAYNANSWLSGVIDVGGYHTSRDISLPCILALGTCPARQDFKGNTWTYLFGPRLSYRHLGRFTPFGQVLFGIDHATPNVLVTGNQTNFAMTLGGGIDYRLAHRLSVRPLQVDYLLTHFNEFGADSRPTQNNLRLSTGLVLHF
jgi:opacity protein-like surface antigen